MRHTLAALVIALVTSAGAVVASDEHAYVINTTGETLSRVNLTTGQVANDLLPLGSDVICAPNQIVVRDGLGYVVNSLTDEIQIIDLTSVGTIGFIDFPDGANPFWMACYDSRYAYVTNLLANSLARIDLVSRSIVTEIGVGAGPEGVIIHDHKAYVANTNYNYVTYEFDDGTVSVIDIPGDSLLYDLAVGMNPQYFARDLDNRLHVVCTGDYGFGSPPTWGVVYVIDPVSDAVVDSVALGGSPTTIAIGPDNVAYLAASGYFDSIGSIFSYQAGTLEVYHGSSNPIIADSGCWTVVAYQDSTLYEANFSDSLVQRDSSGAALVKYGLGDGPSHLDFNYRPGDVNGDFDTDISDLTDLIAWLFTAGQPPRWPWWRANTNGDLGYNIADVTYLVGFFFAGGPAPVVGPTWLQP